MAASDLCERVTCLAVNKSGGFVGEGGQHEAIFSIEPPEEFGQCAIDGPGLSASTAASRRPLRGNVMCSEAPMPPARI